uniref:Putative secreted protein n=1 Tax=Amblyomma americanum TaxID=6943 RepID=A0A0C9SD66_AMBAM
MKFPLHSVCFLLALAATSECVLPPRSPAHHTTTTKHPAAHRPARYSMQRHPRVQAHTPPPPEWVPQGPSVCPVLCAPGLQPGDICGNDPHCRCAIDLSAEYLHHYRCIYIRI